VYNVRDIDVRLESIDISDNITINETRHNLCQLSVTLTNVNLKSVTYIKELQYYRRDQFYEFLIDAIKEIFFIFVGVGAAFVLGYFLIIICIIILCICCYCCSSYYHKNKSKKIELGESSITKDEQNGTKYTKILHIMTL
jgi:Ca2+-dependent lipid-binding protein